MRLLHSNVIGVYEVCARVCVLVCFEGGGGVLIYQWIRDVLYLVQICICDDLFFSFLCKLSFYVNKLIL